MTTSDPLSIKTFGQLNEDCGDIVCCVDCTCCGPGTLWTGADCVFVGFDFAIAQLLYTLESG